MERIWIDLLEAKYINIKMPDYSFVLEEKKQSVFECCW
ncbi:hypothetical protein J2X92_002663 [Variovorax paradoxus]|nr:hypothetical protein [Variovorax paradoxus]